jgi:N-methylhydantoinase B/oxoprolinase/acetone carboxylase alpha subunit
VLVSTPGGGGYGPARARPRAVAERDRALGYVGRAAARRRSRAG